MTVLDPVWLAWIGMSVLAAWLSSVTLRLLAFAAVAMTFLALYDPLSAVTLAAMSLITFAGAKGASRRAIAVAMITVLLLGLLITFKLRSSELGIAMPLGMSYYTFRCIHYLLEKYKRRLPPHTFSEYLGYIFFLPTILAGPIHRFPEFHRDLRRRTLTRELVSEGLERILYGYAKIIILANFLVSQHLRMLADSVGSWSPRLGAYLEMLAGGLNGYLQFAGYSDIAIGASLLMGFRVMENFNSPFLSRNIVEFWQRWHISLTSWVRTYLYTAVFALSRKPYAAAVVTMLAIGLWHEISMRYVLWGLMHGAAVTIYQALDRNRERLGLPQRGRFGATGSILAWLATFHFVLLSFVLVQHDKDGAIAAYRTMLLGAS